MKPNLFNLLALRVGLAAAAAQPAITCQLSNQVVIEASTNLPGWSPLGIVTVTNANGTAPIPDPDATGARKKFYRAVTH